MGELLGIIRCLAWNAHTDGCTIDTAAAVQHVQDMLDGELARIEYDRDGSRSLGTRIIAATSAWSSRGAGQPGVGG